MPKFFEKLETRTFFAASTFVLEAEAAAVSGAAVAADIGGYTGSGYVDYLHAWNDSVEWTVNAPAAGTHRLSFRYANGAGDRPLELRVNGQVRNSRFSMPGTGSWQTWKTVNVDVALNAGANKVRLTAIGLNGPNLDSLTVTTPDVTEPPPPPPPPPPTPGTYEAESAARSGPTVDNSVPGFTGSGFVDYGGVAGQWVEWTVNPSEAGSQALTFRYANGSSDRPLELRVNGQVINPRLSMPNTGGWSTWKTVSANATLVAGANKIRLTSLGAGPNIDSLKLSGEVEPPPPPPPPPTGTYEAESAARSGPTVDNSIPGFTGTGFVDYGGVAGQWVEWTVNEPSAGTRALTIRYANGSTDRPVELRVNGQVVNGRVSLPNTGSWGTWKTVAVTAPLVAGANKIRLTSLGAGPNIDSLKVSGEVEPPPPPPPPPGGVFEAESANLYGPAVARSNTGFTGTGYADYARVSGDVIEWVVNSAAAGTRTVTFRYANGGANSTLQLQVNGQVVNPALAFPNTGGWRTWKTVTASIPLAAGPGAIRLITTGVSGPNIDSLTVPNATQPSVADRLTVAAAFAAEQLRRTAADIPTDRYVTRTNSDGTWAIEPDIGWEAGFLPGAMWQMYQRTGDAFWKDQAAARTTPLQVQRNRHYDTSFLLFKSFKPLLDQTGDPAYRQVLLDAAAAKAGAFNQKAGVFVGWNRGSQSPDPRADVGTYIDLMSDLELILWAAKETGNTAWRDMAIRHATESAEHLVRPDGSTIQWGYFDEETGAFVLNEQYQGYDVNSTWSRGQAWAIYGFTLAYRETGNPLFLTMAKKTADWYLAHLPADKVPFWDFNDPSIPNVPKDTSAAAIAASGLLDLARQLSGSADATRYRAAAEATLLSLTGPSYSAQGSTYRSILRRGALNVPRDSGNSVGLIFGDYYFLEGINRYFAP